MTMPTAPFDDKGRPPVSITECVDSGFVSADDTTAPKTPPERLKGYRPGARFKKQPPATPDAPPSENPPDDKQAG
jgi:hypothetical protein